MLLNADYVGIQIISLDTFPFGFNCIISLLQEITLGVHYICSWLPSVYAQMGQES